MASFLRGANDKPHAEVKRERNCLYDILYEEAKLVQNWQLRNTRIRRKFIYLSTTKPSHDRFYVRSNFIFRHFDL